VGVIFHFAIFLALPRFYRESLYLKNGLKKIAEKKTIKIINYIYYEVCTAIALCFPDILHVMVLENINCIKIK
jgi:hypothetical protein